MLPPLTPPREIFTPSDLNRLVRDLLEDALPLLWVQGEISNLARPASGHMYFSLKDSRAQIRCAMFRPASTRIGFRPKDGDQVMLRGRVGLYEARGDFQLIVEHMEEAGEGALRREFERLKAQLDAEGLFASERKRPLPAMPRRIGVISSPTGAAVRDVLSVLGRRFPLAEVEVLPVPVQGKEAPAAIKAMLERAQRSERYDVLLLTRGGGSLEDLWAFNDEALARAIAGCAVPVVSAVGHEIDFTLADFAADVRAATPSVAAELLVPERADLLQRLAHLQQRLNTHMRRGLLTSAQRLDHLQSRIRLQHPQLRLQRGAERLDAVQQRLRRTRPVHSARERVQQARMQLLAQHPQAQVARLTQQCRELGTRLTHAQAVAAERRRSKLASIVRALHAVSPLATLQRGYAILLNADGSVLRSALGVKRGAMVRARLADGVLQLQNTGETHPPRSSPRR